MMTIHRGRQQLLLLVLGVLLFAYAVVPATGAGKLVIGSKVFQTPIGRGWGTTEPKRLYNGGVPSGDIDRIHWESWGGPTAIGWGRTIRSANIHRSGAPFSRVHSVTSIDSQPNQEFASATISQINETRNFVNADVDVPNGDRPALLIFSRPYFRGYKARIGDQKFAVTSYRRLFPILKVPADTHRRLMVAYKPP